MASNETKIVAAFALASLWLVILTLSMASLARDVTKLDAPPDAETALRLDGLEAAFEGLGLDAGILEESGAATVGSFIFHAGKFFIPQTNERLRKLETQTATLAKWRRENEAATRLAAGAAVARIQSVDFRLDSLEHCTSEHHAALFSLAASLRTDVDELKRGMREAAGEPTLAEEEVRGRGPGISDSSPVEVWSQARYERYLRCQGAKERGR